MNKKLPYIFAAIFAISITLRLSRPDDDLGPVEPIGDVLDQSYALDRAARLDILDRMQGMEFETNGEAGDWFNSQILPARAEAFIPFTDALAEAIDGGTLDTFTESLR